MYQVIANSLPLGGTFLLLKLLDSLGYTNYAQTPQSKTNHTPAAFNYQTAQEALHGVRNTPAHESIAISPFAPWYVPAGQFQNWLDVLPKGHYISGHLPWSAALDSMLPALNYRQVLIWRNPQEVLVDLISEAMPRFLRADLDALTFSERVHFFLQGGIAPKLGVNILPFAAICRSMLRWANNQNSFLLYVEDLINLDQQTQVINDLADFLEIKLNKINLPVCLEKINAFPRLESNLESLFKIHPDLNLN